MPAKFGRTEKNGRHVGTRTPDLYRVKTHTSSITNHLQEL